MEESKKNSFILDRVDYKGDPADRNTTGGWVPAALIVGESRKFIFPVIKFVYLLFCFLDELFIYFSYNAYTQLQTEDQ
jgi:hypothetical protein